MFKPIKTPATNCELGKPKDWDDSAAECVTLPAYYDGTCFYSWYAVSWRDRLRILFGRPIRLVVFGRTHPPVSVEVSPERFSA